MSLKIINDYHIRFSTELKMMDYIPLRRIHFELIKEYIDTVEKLANPELKIEDIPMLFSMLDNVRSKLNGES